MTDDIIDEPRKGIEFANKHIRRLEMMEEEFRQKEDYQSAAKCEWSLTKWADILQHFIRESYQEGQRTKDATTISLKDEKGKKSRFESTD